MSEFLLIYAYQEMEPFYASTFPNIRPDKLVVPRDFGRREAEKLVTDRENYRSDNFAALGEWVV